MRTLLALTLVLTCSVGLADELPSNTREIETLTVEQAETLVGRNQWSLYLDGLITLSPDVAKILAQVKGQISLNGLTTLSKETAEQLAAPPQEKHRSRSLSLNGLSTLSPAVAEELAKIKGRLSLRGLKVVSPQLAAILITQNSFRDGDFGLESISPDLAQLLARSESHLDLSSLKSLDPQTASALSQHTASIDLSGLRLIDRDSAQALAKYRGMVIVLAGLRSINTDVASELSHWPGEKLYLDGLAQLDPETAACLAECKTKQLGLSGLNSISPEIAAELAKFSGSSLNLSGLTQPSLDVIQCLGTFHGSLNLGGLSSLDREKARAIGRLESDRLQLSATNDSSGTGKSWGGGVDDHRFDAYFRDDRDGYSKPARINSEIAAALSLFQGKELVLRGLTTIDKESAQALSSFEGERLSLECLDSIDDVTFELLEKTTNVEIKIEDFRRLTARQAHKLVERSKGSGWSSLENLESVDKAVAKELLEFKGNIYLYSLKSIDDDALEILKQRPNLNLNLDNLSSLTTKQLRHLLDEKKGGYLSLQLESLTPEMARMLSSHDGEINLHQLQTLSDECFDILLESDLKRPQYHSIIRNLRFLSPHQASVLSEHLNENEFDNILSNLDAIDVPLASWLVENRTDISCPGTTLDPKVAEVLAKHKGDLTFWDLESISAELARSLSGFEGTLWTCSVTRLSEETEKVLAELPGTLALHSLQHINTAALAAKLVASHNKQEFYGILYFEDLQTLSIPVAKELVKAKGGLFLPSIKTLSEDVAAILATCQDELYLPGLTQLESLPLAEKFLGTAGYFRSVGTGIELNNLKWLFPQIAEVLSKYKAGLSLNGLRDISPATARNLMNCEGPLLIGLPELRPEIAKIFVHYRGDLVLNIENLTPEAAKVLVNREGDLKLGLKQLKPDVAKILVNREDPLWIGEVAIDEELANILAQTRGDLYVELRTMNPQLTAALVRKEGTLVLWGLRGDRNDFSRSSQLSKEVAKQLASTKGTVLLSLDQNQPLLSYKTQYKKQFRQSWELDRETADILAETEGTLILESWSNDWTVAEKLAAAFKGTLFLPSFTPNQDGDFPLLDKLNKPNVHVGEPCFWKSLSAEEAAILVLIYSIEPPSEHWGCPRGVERITVETAIELAAFRGDFINLHVTTLSPEAAKALANYHGILILHALESLTPEVAKQLIKCQGGLSLPKLAKPTPEVCEILASYDGSLGLSGLAELESVDLASKLVENTSESDWMLSFDGLTSISLPIAAALARSHATVSLAGLTAISEKQARALARCSGGLSLGGLTELTAETAKELAQCKGTLILDGLTTIDPKVAEILSNARGELFLGGLHSLTSVALARKLVVDANNGAPDEWSGERVLRLDSLKKITPAVAEVLSSTNVPLELNGLEEIDSEVAQALSGSAGALSLNSLKIIDAGMAKSLLQTRDSLSLAGLESITASIANEFAQFTGELDLSGLKEPKKEIVQALEKKKMGTLYLSQDVLDKFPALTENEIVEVGYGGMGGGIGGGMF